MAAITLETIREAARAIAEHINRTPCALSRTLSEITGAQVFIKFENLQFTGSFKERGALFKLLSLTPSEHSAGVIAMSAGNHAQAVAYHARRLGIPAVIVMPRFTPHVKVEHTKRFGAEVVLHGEDLTEAGEFASTTAARRGLHLIHPYDDERIIAGQGTVALEFLEAQPALECLLIPVGGGGLIAGNALAAKAINPAIRVFGVQTARYPSMRQALAGEPIRCGRSTLAEGIAVKSPGRLTLPIIREAVEEILLVDENDIEKAVLLFLEGERTVAEGAGAAGLAALLANPERFRGRRVGLVLSGGNIDLMVLSTIIQRGLVRTGRLGRLTVELADSPGSLAEVTAVLGRLEANIVEVLHQRTFVSLPLQSAEVEFILQTRGLPHMRAVVEGLRAEGIEGRWVEQQAD